jgi:DNA-binding transcriptional MerR regulator
MEGFTAAQACRYTGSTPHQIRYWDRIKLVKPSLQSTGGRPGVRRLYSFRDLVALKCVKSLLESGMSLQRIRRAYEYLRRKADLDTHISEVRLVSDGQSIFEIAQDDGQLIDLLREGQLAFYLAIDDAAQTQGGIKAGHLYDRDEFLARLRVVESELEKDLPTPARQRLWAAR